MATPEISRPDTPQESLPTQTHSQSEYPSSKRTSQPFPSITGSCVCNAIQYRLLSAPLFVHACHCADCQKLTGSAFGIFLNIEFSNVKLLTPAYPLPKIYRKTNGTLVEFLTCPRCCCALWAHVYGPSVASVLVGTLDFAGLFEPDVHSFVESKVDWLVLPDAARVVKHPYDYRDYWPRSSLKRLELCTKRYADGHREKALRALEAAADGQAQDCERGGEGARGDGDGDGDTTPTASGYVEGSEGPAHSESDEAFSKRCREMERALQARLEKLRAKLEEEDEKSVADLDKMVGNMALGDNSTCNGVGE